VGAKSLEVRKFVARQQSSETSENPTQSSVKTLSLNPDRANLESCIEKLVPDLFYCGNLTRRNQTHLRKKLELNLSLGGP
jgi:hypothetical protein